MHLAAHPGQHLDCAGVVEGYANFREKAIGRLLDLLHRFFGKHPELKPVVCHRSYPLLQRRIR
jgi:hypothetical protein